MLKDNQGKKPKIRGWRIQRHQRLSPIEADFIIDKGELREYLVYTLGAKFNHVDISAEVLHQFSVRKQEMIQGRTIKNVPEIERNETTHINHLHDLTLRESKKNLEGVRKDAIRVVESCFACKRYKIELI